VSTRDGRPGDFVPPDDLRDLWRGVQGLQQRLPEFSQALAAIVGQGTSPDGMVSARCDVRGGLLDLEVSERRYRNTESYQLREDVLAAVDAASADARRRLEELTREYSMEPVASALRGDFQPPPIVGEIMERMRARIPAGRPEGRAT
jgi:DNA-binding protein YbaB